MRPSDPVELAEAGAVEVLEPEEDFEQFLLPVLGELRGAGAGDKLRVQLKAPAGAAEESAPHPDPGPDPGLDPRPGSGPGPNPRRAPAHEKAREAARVAEMLVQLVRRIQRGPKSA
ncbi:MORF4 family-associated protein 1-like 1 [Suncus etruscus]|uniref:MORF4 family-associated protein 1-like 1 n=1 Tax=Suncus etruscus TaxID=109475 RepID=UPI00210F5124|nr:MORF4 family-associated protein 1-like 1 [Suncus etruscus]